jgi:hypothetical protein
MIAPSKLNRRTYRTLLPVTPWRASVLVRIGRPFSALFEFMPASLGEYLMITLSSEPSFTPSETDSVVEHLELPMNKVVFGCCQLSRHSKVGFSDKSTLV